MATQSPERVATAPRAEYSCTCGFIAADDSDDVEGFQELCADHARSCVQALGEDAFKNGLELHVALTFIRDQGLMEKYLVFSRRAMWTETRA